MVKKLLTIILLLTISEIIGYLNYKYANDTVIELNTIIEYAKAIMNLTAICASKEQWKSSIDTINIMMSNSCSACLHYKKSCEICNYAKSVLQTYNGEPPEVILKKLLENEEIRKYYENLINEIYLNDLKNVEKWINTYKKIKPPKMLIPLTLNIYYYSYFIFYPRIVKSAINIAKEDTLPFNFTGG